MQNKIKRIAVVGSTGSIGGNTLDVARYQKNHIEILGLAAGNNISLLQKQINEFKPRFVYCNQFNRLVGTFEYLPAEEMASHPDVDLVIIATTGKAGLNPTIAALKAGKTVAIANKEILVMAGEILTAMASKYKATILPIDSEHSAIWQCLRGEDRTIKKIILTASGGPFFNRTDDLSCVSVEQALNHPTWKMGKKVTIDSATLFNKGMEVIEAHHLFHIPYDRIEIFIHRQSIIHSMVEFIDGSIKAQLSVPDMRLPIQYAIFYPERMINPSIESIDFSRIRNLTFEPVDYQIFPCLQLALNAAQKGCSYPAVLCAADEVAVQSFLNRQIKFNEIAHIIENTLNLHKAIPRPEMEDILAADEWARDIAYKIARKEI